MCYALETTGRPKNGLGKALALGEQALPGVDKASDRAGPLGALAARKRERRRPPARTMKGFAAVW